MQGRKRRGRRGRVSTARDEATRPGAGSVGDGSIGTGRVGAVRRGNGLVPAWVADAAAVWQAWGRRDPKRLPAADRAFRNLRLRSSPRVLAELVLAARRAAHQIGWQNHSPRRTRKVHQALTKTGSRHLRACCRVNKRYAALNLERHPRDL